jgi:hypothetical protein
VKFGADKLENNVEAVGSLDKANIFHDIVMLLAGQQTRSPLAAVPVAAVGV